MKKRLTLTIGIPVYNEQNNIAQILETIMTQVKRSYILEKIIVVSDGSTDKTSEIVKKLSKKYKQIVLIDDGRRLGKINRLNELYKKSTSDIYITFDADIKLGNKYLLEEIVRNFSDTGVGLVGTNTLPLPPQNFLETIIITWFMIWSEIKKTYKNGNTIHNHLGCVSAMRKSLYKNIRIPKNIVADDDYLFFSAIKLGYTFQYAKNAVVYYRTVSTLKDFYNQHARFINGKDAIAAHFGNWVYDFYKVPQKEKIRALSKMFVKSPQLVVLAAGLQSTLLLYKNIQKKTYGNGVWETAQSSKRVSITV